MRVDVEDGWHYVTARGNQRRTVFADDADRRRFLELPGEWVERYGLRLYGDGLMENHYHLLVRTPQANRSRARQRLPVGSTVWFNRRRVEHLLQRDKKLAALAQHAMHKLENN